MKCSRCQHENPYALKFCGECGARLAAVCATCGAANAPEQKFCGECGGKLSFDTAKPKLPSPDSHTSEHLAEKITSSKSALEGERRQLTVLFCDMVGFTELANRVDPEVLQRIIRSYEDACAVCITRYEGYVFQRLGDGIVAFFGYPLAHEGEAERAIHAGLEIIATLSQLEVPEVGHLQVRIGIATGVVVVSSAEKGAVGETMNLASRLQGVAQPGSIVVSERVHRLAGGSFEYEDLGEQTLKGIARPTRAYRILRVSEAASRFEAATQERLTPLVGREQEIGLLLERWQLAQDGEGQVVLLSGEPGIGKSRILSALRERLEAQGAQALRFQCSPYYVNSAFWPSIDNFERALRFGRDESPESKLGKLEALMVTHYGRPLGDVRFVASILSIPCEERYGALTMTPQKHKDETQRSLVDLTEAAARKQPSVMLYEDVHWADPTSLETLDLLIDRVRNFPLLIVLTHRPEFQSRWAQHGHVVGLNLSKLTRAQSGAMVSGVAGGKALPPQLLEQILTKTDGVPLFVEELTKSILESGELKEAGDHYEHIGSAHSITIPATLRDSLMARLDRFMPVKEIAQIGAAIGREFSYELIAAVAPTSKATLDDSLDRLTVSGLAFRRGTPPDATYTFKHALVQDAAYDSLLKSRRQELHAKIARVIEERFPNIKDTEPEVLAHHYTHAGRTELALPYWQKAGESALRRMGVTEAITHLTNGLTLTDSLMPSQARDARELELRTLLGTAWIAAGGWADPHVWSSYGPARDLARSLGRRDLLSPILWGLWVNVLCNGRIAESLQWAKEMLTSAKEGDDRALEVTAQMTMMISSFWLGDFAAAAEHGKAVSALYAEEDHRWIVDAINQDPRTTVGLFGSQWTWMLGFPDQAMQLCNAKDARARDLGHAFNLGFALGFGSWVFDYREEPEELFRHADECEKVGRENGLIFLVEMQAVFTRARALVRAGRLEEGVAMFERYFQSPMCLPVSHPYNLAVQAEALAHLHRYDQALERVNRAIEQIDRPGWGERSHYAEVLRVRGSVLALRGDLEGAEQNYLASLDWAREQQTKSWELRTSTSLARLWQSQGKRKAGVDLLAPVYNWFTEGFNTKDLKEAKALLDQLA
jgi:class 3 adenylate cyclase/predicted ATPase